MAPIKPRRIHIMLLACVTIIVTVELFIHMDNESRRVFIQRHREQMLRLMSDELNITLNTTGRDKRFMDDDTVRLNQTPEQIVHNNASEILHNIEPTLDEEGEKNISTTTLTGEYRDTHNVSQVQEEQDSSVNLSDVKDENNELDMSSMDELITLDTVLEQKPADRHADTLKKRRSYKWNGDYEQVLENSEQYRIDIHNAFYRPPLHHTSVDCPAVVRHEDDAIAKAKAIMHDVPRRSIPVEKYAKITDCENFRGGRGYIEHPLSQLELNFPLAFGILAYRDVEQAERLLRSIYRPHNFYCIHLDVKMRPIEKTAMKNVADCLDNVFVAETSINVTWGEFSVLEAELICMKSLVQYKRWKYYINLTGQEFPLKTNKEIVSILAALEGANIVDGTWIRAKEKYFYRWTQAGHPPPHRIRPIKGSVHVAVNRHFVDFALNDYRARDFLEWLKRTQIPDETFFASLNHNPRLGINGSFLGEPEEYPLKPSLMRYKNWELGHSVFVRSCEGKFVRNICVLGVGDLYQAYNDIGLFVNKLNLDFEYLALDCLEEMIYERTWSQYMNNEKIDTTYYHYLDYVKKKLYVPP